MIQEITIIIPEANYVNRLATCLYGLVYNSYYKHNIFVITSGTSHIEGNGTNRFTGTIRFSSIDQYIKDNKKFIDDNRIYFVDVSLSKENVSKYFLKYNIEKPEPNRWEGGIDCAFKDNFGIDLAKTEWIMPNFDDDFFPSKNWDLNLFKAEINKMAEREVYVPTHVQPYGVKFLKEHYGMDQTNIDMNFIWNDSRRVACSVIVAPADRDHVHVHLLESEWNAFVSKYSINNTIYEPCGSRKQLHYLPMLFKKSDILRIGGYSLMGCGYDLNVDDRFAQHNYIKASRQDSFILHKGFIEFDQSKPWG